MVGPSYIHVNGHPYQVLKRIGKGGSSVVYSALDSEQNLRAIKRVDLSSAEAAEAEAYLNEIQMLERLQGADRIVRMYDFEHRAGDAQELLVVMEKGETDLHARLKGMLAADDADENGGISEVDRRFYWREMLRAVHAIHNCRPPIVHADLKPANFLLVSGKLKLIDFGIASSVQTDKTSVLKDTKMGTLNYMSPEALMEDENQPNQVLKLVILICIYLCDVFRGLYSRNRGD